MAVQASSIPATALAVDLVLEERPPLTGEELFKMGDVGRTELVKGEIVYMAPTGYLHGHTEYVIGKVLGAFAEHHHLGQVMVGEVGL